MLFTSESFLFFFLPLVLLGLRLSLTFSGGLFSLGPRLWLIAATIVFYGHHHWWYLLPFAVSIGFDFGWAYLLSRIVDSVKRRWIVALSVFQNLSLLAYFKYSRWMALVAFDNVPALAHYREAVLPLLPSELPPGISFYTFESLSFVIDSYRRVISFPKRATDFFSFIAMFPRFIAGPIVRYAQIQDQLVTYRGPRIRAGLTVFAYGFFLKAALADLAAESVPLAFSVHGPSSVVAAWVGTLAYSLQIYLDFAGYSWMAIGLGKCLGFQFPQNFAQPYLSCSLQDFWRRWHMSLSQWLRDYLYIPLGGNRRGALTTYRNVFLTMCLGGLWHGASSRFLLWGAWHGLWLVLDAWFERRLPGVVRRLVVLPVVLVGWVLFRADSLREAGKILQGLVGIGVPGYWDLPIALTGLKLSGLVGSLLFVLAVDPRLREGRVEKIDSPSLAATLLAAFAFGAALEISREVVPRPFLYFQF